MTFEITTEPLEDIIGRLNQARHPSIGGITTFSGVVRNHNEGKAVQSLLYESYESMAIKEGEKILDSAKERFAISYAHCIHRVGHLQVGELAVWINVQADHRGDTFSACQFIIDSIKKTVPMWKKEFYSEHPAQWVQCHHSHG